MFLIRPSIVIIYDNCILRLCVLYVCCQRYVHVCTYCRTGSARVRTYIVKCARSRVMDLQMKHTPPLMHRHATHSLKPADARTYEYVYTHTHARTHTHTHTHFHYNTRHIPSPSVQLPTGCCCCRTHLIFFPATVRSVLVRVNKFHTVSSAHSTKQDNTTCITLHTVDLRCFDGKRV